MRVKNIAWNMLGLGTPALFAAATIPSILKSIGVDRFGILTLVWGLIAFSGVFDLGIGRAATQAIARARNSHDPTQIPAILAASVRLTTIAGIIAGALLFILALAGIHRLLNVEPYIASEVYGASLLVAAILPFQTSIATFKGVNEAFENFRGISILRMIQGGATFLAPFLIAQISSDLRWIVAALLLSRIAALYFFRKLALACLERHSAIDLLATPVKPSRLLAKSLLTFGGWVTVSSILYPLMMQADRFIIGSKVSTAAVAAYTIPYELIMQALLLAGAITTVAFPYFSHIESLDSRETRRVFHKWLLRITVVMALIATLLATASPLLLSIWLGDGLPPQSAAVAQILSLGLVPYTVGTMYLAIIHARGRSDITAKAHAMQAPVYIYLLHIVIDRYGIEGAAWLWSARAALDAAGLLLWFESTSRGHHEAKSA